MDYCGHGCQSNFGFCGSLSMSDIKQKINQEIKRNFSVHVNSAGTTDTSHLSCPFRNNDNGELALPDHITRPTATLQSEPKLSVARTLLPHSITAISKLEESMSSTITLIVTTIITVPFQTSHTMCIIASPKQTPTMSQGNNSKDITGTCGSQYDGANNNLSCDINTPWKCYSKFGHCGSTDAHCGPDCQPEFGLCDSNNLSLVPSSQTSTTSFQNSSLFPSSYLSPIHVQPYTLRSTDTIAAAATTRPSTMRTMRRIKSSTDIQTHTTTNTKTASAHPSGFTLMASLNGECGPQEHANGTRRQQRVDCLRSSASGLNAAVVW
jgi:hypothetical protein